MRQVERFLSGRVSAGDVEGLARRLDERVTAAAQRWAVEEAALVEALATRAPAGDALAALDALHVDDVALTLAVAAHHPAALTHFDAALKAATRQAVSRIDDSPAFVDEVTQVLRQRLLLAPAPARPGVLEYSGRGPLENWLRVAAVRQALSLRRGAGARATASDEELLELDADQPGPELELLRGRYREQFRAAFAAAFRVLSSQQRNLLRLHHLDGLSLNQLAVHYGLHRTTLARHLDQARQALFDETRRDVAERLQLGREDFEALVAVLRSQLDVSIRRFLQATGG